MIWKYVVTAIALFVLAALWFLSILQVAELTILVTENPHQRIAIVVMYIMASIFAVIGSLCFTPRLFAQGKKD